MTSSTLATLKSCIFLLNLLKNLFKVYFVVCWRRIKIYKRGTLFRFDKTYFDPNPYTLQPKTNSFGVIIKRVPFLCIYFVYLDGKFGFLEAETIRVLK